MKHFRVVILVIALLGSAAYKANQILNPYLELAGKERLITILLYSDVKNRDVLLRELRLFICQEELCVFNQIPKIIGEEFARYTGQETTFTLKAYEPVDDQLFTFDFPESGVDRLKFVYRLYQEFRKRGASFFGSDIRIFINISDYDANNYEETSMGSANLRTGFIQWDVADQFKNVRMWNLTKLMHEIGHTLGASDKYLDVGKSAFPDGYIQPELGENSNQSYVEIMSGTRPTGTPKEAEPIHPGQLRFGAQSAMEMGWLR